MFHVCVLCCLEWPAEVIIWWSPLSRLTHRWKSQSVSACNVGKVRPLWWDVYALYLDVTQTVFIVRVKECASSAFALIPEGVNHTGSTATVISIQVSFKFIFNRWVLKGFVAWQINAVSVFCALCSTSLHIWCLFSSLLSSTSLWVFFCFYLIKSHLEMLYKVWRNHPAPLLRLWLYCCLRLACMGLNQDQGGWGCVGE